MNGVGKINKKLTAKGRNSADRFHDTVHYPVDLLVETEHFNDFVYPEKTVRSSYNNIFHVRRPTVRSHKAT